jgi:hypothetical protein
MDLPPAYGYVCLERWERHPSAHAYRNPCINGKILAASVGIQVFLFVIIGTTFSKTPLSQAQVMGVSQARNRFREMDGMLHFCLSNFAELRYTHCAMSAHFCLVCDSHVPKALILKTIKTLVTPAASFPCLQDHVEGSGGSVIDDEIVEMKYMAYLRWKGQDSHYLGHMAALTRTVRNRAKGQKNDRRRRSK